MYKTSKTCTREQFSIALYTCSSNSHVLVSCTRNFTCLQNMHLHVSVTIIEVILPDQTSFDCYKYCLLCWHAFNMWKVLHKYWLFYEQAINLQCSFDKFGPLYVLQTFLPCLHKNDAFLYLKKDMILLVKHGLKNMYPLLLKCFSIYLSKCLLNLKELSFKDYFLLMLAKWCDIRFSFLFSMHNKKNYTRSHNSCLLELLLRELLQPYFFVQ